MHAIIHASGSCYACVIVITATDVIYSVKYVPTWSEAIQWKGGVQDALAAVRALGGTVVKAGR